MDGLSWLLHSWITYPAPEKSRLQSQNPEPTRAVQASDPHLCPTQSFSPVSSKWCGSPVQDSGRDGHYGSLLVVLYYLGIELRESAKSLSRPAAIHSGLQGSERWLAVMFCPSGSERWLAVMLFSLREWTLIGIMGVVAFNPQAPKIHCLPFLGQEGTKFEIYVTIRLHIWPTFNTDSCLHRWNIWF